MQLALFQPARDGQRQQQVDDRWCAGDEGNLKGSGAEARSVDV